MCGITALFRTGEGSAPLSGFIEMNRILKHRGPDDEGFVLLDPAAGKAFPVAGEGTPRNVLDGDQPYLPKTVFHGSPEGSVSAVLGHRRLSIIDLTPAGHQPMSYLNGRFWIVFNGEIYNHAELRKELEGLGHRFVSHTDTEVILASYAQWGKDCLSRFNGMWAFIIVDLEKRKVFGARDRFGVKPFYYWFSPSGFLAMASEIKAFTVLPGWRAVLDREMAYHYLNWGLSDHTDRTMFQGVRQLRGSYAFEADLDRLKEGLPIYRYYETAGGKFNGSLSDAAARFKTIFKDSVRLRMMADVPIGSCLSGGLDSSSIVCLVSEVLNGEGKGEFQRTFSARGEHKEADESRYIEEVVSSRKIDAHYVTPRLAELYPTLDSMIWYQDEPFGSTSTYAQWCVFKLAAENEVIVMLDGQGADEQIAGYHSFLYARLVGLLRGFHLVAFAREMKAIKKRHGYSTKFMLTLSIGQMVPETVRTLLKRRKGLDAESIWFDLNVLGVPSGEPFKDLGGKGLSIQPLARSQMLFTSLPKLLHSEDRSSMAHSIESRVPFLDYRLVELSASLPESYLLDRGVTKKILRESMSGTIPDKIRDRVDKLGFATPEEVWLKGDGRELFRKALSDAVATSKGIVRPECLKEFDLIANGKKPFNNAAWRMICFGAWMRLFSVELE